MVSRRRSGTIAPGPIVPLASGAFLHPVISSGAKRSREIFPASSKEVTDLGFEEDLSTAFASLTPLEMTVVGGKVGQ